ncbi:MAG: hypothetical protein NZM31_11375 [Gemmatales bacterium]|nr:hypothetical protein [Gemmatales bacterium]MDW8387598.1 hypothetical protein [Gemmatales bacterium]
MIRLAVLGCLLMLLSSLLPTAHAQDSTLDEAQKRRKIEAERLEMEIRNALAEADKIKASEPSRAVQILEAALEKLSANTALSIAQTATLRVTLKDRIEAIKSGRAKAEAEQAEGRNRLAELDRRLARLQAQAERDEALRRDLAIVKDLMARGKLAEAARLSEELAQRHSDNPAAGQQRQVAGLGERVREAYRITEEKAGASVSALNDVARSGIPPAGDIVYPPKEKWDKLTRDRKKFLEIPMTEREKQIVAILNSEIPTPTELRDITFRKFLDDFQKETGLPVLVNQAALKDLGIDYENTFTISLPRKVTRRSLLRTALAELGLTYVIRNETIEIMDVERAKNCMTVRVIPIDDLLLGFGGLAPPILPNGNANTSGKTPIDLLIDMIQDTIEPLSWQKYNGPGSITYYAPQRALIIRNSAEVINMIGGRTR